MLRLCLFLCGFAVVASPAAFERYCIDCHDAESHEGGIDFDQLLAERPLVRNREVWEHAMFLLRERSMPPEDKRQPSDAERQAMLDWLQAEVTDFDYESVDNPGYEPARRMTFAEYAHAVRDLFGMKIDLADRFASDLSGASGFDNSANTLFLQNRTFEQYLANAEYCVDIAKPDMPLPEFLRRAWRRPPTAQEIRELRKVAKSAKEAYMVALASPHFIMKIESPVAPGAAQAISDWDLASRLSFFLWASGPDEELLDLAEAGTLSEAATLERQVLRMLKDRRARTLGTHFAAQWLGFDALGTRIRLDPIDNPWCTDSLMDAMRAESAIFVHHLFRDNRPLHELIHADYSYLNEELARHYRIRGIEGEEMRRVDLDSPVRGGIVSHSSVLAVTSFPHRTSPVLRGTWILTNLLGTPPPPPPPNAGELEVPESRRGRELSLRERLTLHRDNPKCASCHSRIDPLGFSLENYDLFGRWRTRDESGRIDPRATLADAGDFKGPIGLKRVLLQHRHDELSTQITRKLLSYALGRQLEYYDERAVRRIRTKFEHADFHLRELVLAIVHSYPFRYQKLP